MMIAEMFVLSDVIDNDGSAAITNFVADRRLNVEFAARQEAEGNFVTNGASDPTIPRDSRNGREAHSGGAADDFQNGGNRVDPGNCGNVGRQGRIEVRDRRKVCRGHARVRGLQSFLKMGHHCRF